jgi:hypothetical protein
MLTNWNKWREYTSGLPSPDNYIDWGWLYTVSAALQRRVWLGPPHQQCFPNLYVILVGPPGVGKGLVLKEVTSMLKHWTLDLASGNTTSAKTEDEKARVEEVSKLNKQNAQDAEFQGKSKSANTFKPLLIPVCADAITYEALVLAVGSSYRYMNYFETNGSDKPELKAYGHSSLCFILQELSSLMRKRTNDTVNYLLGLYDCPVDYEYTTITRGKDRVRRGCLNIIAGTTPAFMQSTFDEDLIGEGFTSRTFYVYAKKNRKNVMFLPALTPEQVGYKKDLLEHIKKLSTVYGPIPIEKKTEDFLQKWWDDFEQNRDKRRNRSMEMIPYYARKNIHTMKVATAMHFSEPFEVDEMGRLKNPITIETFEQAIAFTEKEETNMHLAICLEGKNPQSKCANKVLEMLRLGKKNFVDLHTATFSLIDREGLEKTLEFLTITKQVSTSVVVDDVTKNEVTYWSII